MTTGGSATATTPVCRACYEPFVRDAKVALLSVGYRTVGAPEPCVRCQRPSWIFVRTAPDADSKPPPSEPEEPSPG